MPFLPPLRSPPPSHLPYYTRLFNLVVESHRTLAQRAAGGGEDDSNDDGGDDDDDSPSISRHVTRTLLPILTLAQTLYLSPNEQHAGQGIIGEELLHWLNSYDLAPTTEQGREIAADAEPYRHPSYWDYILRCTLRGFHSTVSTMLATLLSLPSDSLHSLVTRLRSLVKILPRSVNFKTEVQFKTARREFHLKLTDILSSLEGVMDDVQDELVDGGDNDEEAAEDLRFSLEAGLRIFLEVLAGNKERVIEAAEDWKEALAAWATLVDVGLKRSGLPDAMEKIEALRDGGGDDTASPSPSEQVMILLVKGQIDQACEASAKLDPYLAQVLVDYSAKLGYLAGGSSRRGTLTRANVVYANTLLASYGLWRMAVDYLARAGVEGRQRMREVVVGVPLLDGNADTDTDTDSAASFHLVEGVLSACDTFQLLPEAKATCKRIALYLADDARKQYGPAIVYALRSPPRGDTALIKTIVKRILDGCCRAKTKGSASSHATWLVDQVTDIKLWIIRAARQEQTRREEEQQNSASAGAAPQSAFLSRRRGGPLPASTSDDAVLLQLLQEEEWNHHFAHSLPPALRFLTNLAHYFELATSSASAADRAAAPALMVELLNSGLVPGDWTAVCLHEVRISSAAAASSRLRRRPLSTAHLFDVLRILAAVEASSGGGGSDEEVTLGRLGRWLDGGNSSGGGGGEEDEHAHNGRIARAKQELSRVRLDVAHALGVGSNAGGGEEGDDDDDEDEEAAEVDDVLGEDGGEDGDGDDEDVAMG